MTARIAAALTLLTLLAIAFGGWQWHAKTVAQAAAVSASRDRDIAALTLTEVLRATALGNQLVEVRENENAKQRQTGDARRAQNSADLARVSCAAEPVPDAVGQRLLDHAARVAAGLPAVAVGAADANGNAGTADR